MHLAIHRVRLNIRYILDYKLAVFKLNTFIKSRLVVNCTLYQCIVYFSFGCHGPQRRLNSVSNKFWDVLI